MNNFVYDLNETASIVESGESGRVVGRTEYPHAENMYLIRYKTADGRAVEAWWTESALARSE